MKKFAIIAALAVATPAAAQAETYVELRGGAGFLQDNNNADPGVSAQPVFSADLSFDTGWVGAIAIGHRFDEVLRGEIEYSHRVNDIGTLTGEIITAAGPPPVFGPFSQAMVGDVTLDSVLLMGYFDFPVETAVVPYFGIGAGVAFADTTIEGVSQSDTAPAVQAVFGAAYSISESFALTAGAGVFWTADLALGNAEMNYTSYNILGGLRFTF